MERVSEMSNLGRSQLIQAFASTREPEEKVRILKAIIARIKLLAGQQGDANAAKELVELRQFMEQ
jgi:hypothetical protein